MEKKFKRTTVTSALPYANGPVHIGHLAISIRQGRGNGCSFKFLFHILFLFIC